MRLNDKNLQTGKAELSGASLYYEIAGEGECLVLAHTGIADRTMWDEQFEVFAQHYRVLRYDLRGFGKSPMASGSFSHRQDLCDLLEFLGIEQAHLVGCSAGGATVLDFAVEHPEMTTSLVLVSSAVSGYAFKSEPPQAVLDLVGALEKEDLAKAADLAVQIWADGPKRTPEQVDDGVREQIREMSRVALSNQLPSAEKEVGLEPPAINRLGAIDVPTLVVVGELDDDSILDIGNVLTQRIDGAQKFVIPDAAHMLPMEKPEAFNQAVQDFLQTSAA